MSILITGMEMPKSCGDCPCLSETYCCCVDGVYPYDCNILIQDTEEGSEFIGRLSNCPLVEVPKWIPVTERLPEEYEYVLCKTDYGMEVGYHRDEWGQDEWTTGKFGGGTIDVSHWMPLPQPPEESGEA